MRIVQLANFYNDTSGGLSTALRSLAQHYVREGHEVIRVVPAASSGERHDGTATIIEVASPALGATGYRMVRSARTVDRLLRRVRPDAVELSDKATLVAPAAAMRDDGVRVVLVSHERLDAILRPRVPTGVPLQRITDGWNRRLAPRVDAIVCASQFACEEFRRIGATHVHRIPLGVDLAEFHPAIGGNPDRSAELRLAMVSRLSAEKSPEIAVDTVRELLRRGVATRLDVAGSGPMLDELRDAARELPIHFHGHLSSRRRLVELLRSAQVTLAPCGIETFGLAALESMACGTPVVAASTGALPELIAAGTGAVSHADGPSFADASLAVARTDRRTSEVITRAHAEQFPWSATGAAVLALLSGERPRSREPLSAVTR